MLLSNDEVEELSRIVNLRAEEQKKLLLKPEELSSVVEELDKYRERRQQELAAAREARRIEGYIPSIQLSPDGMPSTELGPKVADPRPFNTTNEVVTATKEHPQSDASPPTTGEGAVGRDVMRVGAEAVRGPISSLLDHMSDALIKDFTPNERGNLPIVETATKVADGLVREGKLMAKSAAEIVDDIIVASSKALGLTPITFAKEAAEHIDVADRPDDAAARVVDYLAKAVPEMLAFATAVKTGGASILALNYIPRIAGAAWRMSPVVGEFLGAAGLSAARVAAKTDDPLPIAMGAVEGALFKGILDATAVLQPMQRVSALASIAYGTSRAAGEDHDEAMTSATAFALLGMLGGAKGDVSLWQAMKERLRNSKIGQAIQEKRNRDILFQSDLEMQGLFPFLRERFPDVAASLEASRSSFNLLTKGGKLKKNIPDLEVLVSQQLDKQLGLVGDAQKVPLRKKLDMLISKHDPQGLMNKTEHRIVVDEAINQIEKTSRGLKAWEAATTAEVKAEAAAKLEAQLKAAEGQEPRIKRTAEEAAEAKPSILPAIRKNRAVGDEIEAQAKRDWRTRLGEQLIDNAGALREKALREWGPFGRALVENFDKMAGATPWAQVYYTSRWNQIYKGLGKDTQRKLDELIRMRIAQATLNRGHTTRWENRYSVSKGLQELKQEVGDATFEDLVTRSDAYFAATRRMLDYFRKEKLISEETYNTIRENDWGPVETMRLVNPQMARLVGKERISSREAPVEFLSKQQLESIEKLDSEQLLAEYVAWGFNAVAKNRANKAAYDLAWTNPDNGVFKPATQVGVQRDRQGRIKVSTLQKPKTPKGKPDESWEPIGVMIDGKEQPLFIKSEWLDLWNKGSPQATRAAVMALRWVGLNQLVRPLATGYNPAFVLTNLPRDLLHIWLTTNEYSKFVPKAVAQIGMDLAGIAYDAFTRRGRFLEYLKEGGGMGFLTHQGVELFPSSNPSAYRRLHPHAMGIKSTLSYLNETSEILTRLMLRERAIKNGKSPAQATWEARRYLDFSRGGNAVKIADHLIPYLNASVQGMRGLGRAWKDDPKAFAIKVAQIALLEAGLYIKNILTNPEGMRDVSDQDKANNWIIMTDTHIRAPQTGDKQHLYFKIRKDQSVAPIASLVNMAMDKFFFNHSPRLDTWDSVSKSLAKFFPVNYGPLSIPSVAAAIALNTSYDAFTDVQLWDGRKPLPWRQYHDGDGRPTPEFWQDFGRLTGLPAASAQLAFSKLVPNNIWLDIGGNVAAGLIDMSAVQLGLEAPGWSAPTTYDLTRIPMQVWLDYPGMRRVASLTNPYTNKAEYIADLSANATTRSIDQAEYVDKVALQVRTGQISASAGWEEVARSAPPEDRQKMRDRYENHLALDRLFGSYDAGLPAGTSRAWWVNVKTLAPMERAHAFYTTYRGASPEERQKMWEIAVALRYNTDENRIFTSTFNTLRQQLPIQYQEPAE